MCISELYDMAKVKNKDKSHINKVELGMKPSGSTLAQQALGPVFNPQLSKIVIKLL